MTPPDTPPPDVPFLRPTLPPEVDPPCHLATMSQAAFCGQTAPDGLTLTINPALATCRKCIVAIRRCDSKKELDLALLKADQRTPRRVHGLSVRKYYAEHPKTHIEDPSQKGWTRCGHRRNDATFETITDEVASAEPQAYEFCQSCINQRFATPQTKKARARNKAWRDANPDWRK